VLGALLKPAFPERVFVIQPVYLSRIHRALGINPGTPVSTTVLNRTLVVMPSRISCMASSGMVESSKFSWIWLGVTEVVRRAVPRCTAQASTTWAGVLRRRCAMAMITG
jgi:hypothetical protein